MTNLNCFIKPITSVLFFLIFFSCSQSQNESTDNEWIELFNHTNTEGWTASENTESWQVIDGILTGVGERSHLFYSGPVANADFKNFELKVEVMTTNLANSGIYFHTKFQDEGWPSTGYEAQVNTSHIGGGDYRELKKAGSLYSIRNTYKKLVPDDEWYEYIVRVEGNHIQIRLNGMLVVDYFQPEEPVRAGDGQRLSSGTFALQCHDPESLVKYRSIQIKLLDDDLVVNNTNPVEINDTYRSMMEHQSRQFSFTDMHVSTGDNFSPDQALSFYYRTGINLGIVTDVTRMEENEINEAIEKLENDFEGLPVFLGVVINNQEVNGPLLEKLDYLISTAGDLSTENPDDFINSVVSDLNSKTMHIWSGAGVIPESLSENPEMVWTGENINKVLSAAKNNNIAIEIDNETRQPSIDFIKAAKLNECRFTYANLGVGPGMGSLDYIFEVIKACDLNYKDIYIP